MADNEFKEHSIGRRIAAWRRRRGYRTAKDLADAIASDAITEAVIQNIEAGRKGDLSVSQLLNIAHTLKVSPAFLLAPVARPFDSLDLPNLVPKLAAMQVAIFEAWLAADARVYPAVVELADWKLLEAQRELFALTVEESRILRDLELELEAGRLVDLTDAQRAEAARFDPTNSRLKAIGERIEALELMLVEAGWFDEPAEDEVSRDGDG